MALRPDDTGTEQELHLVLRDQPRVVLLHTDRSGLVVVALELDLVALIAGLDATGRIDLVAPKFEATHLRQRLVAERACLRSREADAERVLRERGRCRQDGNYDQRQPCEGLWHRGSPSFRARGQKPASRNPWITNIRNAYAS
jgi:hypothetical protein